MPKHIINTELLEDFGPFLSQLRQRHSVLSQTDFAESLGKFQASVSSIEMKNGKIPTLATLVKYLDALGFDLIIQQRK